ncbi:MAG: hypothetical protein M1820_009293 [Bogoriella megaspora]|nr:MAG: hypothetical protein M1820_009293 [Bogoriella megaspora]
MAASSFWAAASTAFLGFILFAVRRVYFSPLARYPGPLLWSLTRLPYFLAYRSGTLAHRLRDFHSQYGEIVRVAPNELSYIRPDAIRDIYAKRPNSSLKTLPKDPVRQPLPRPGQPVSILEANDEDHARIRKGWSYSFSNQALSAQEPLVSSYVDKLINRLTDFARSGAKSVDLQQWYSFCTFDIICSLSFGEDLGCLEQERYHDWVALLVYSIKAKVQIAACRYYPALFFILMNLVPKSAQEKLAKHQAFTREKVQKRLKTETSRPDFLSHLQKSKEGMTDQEIEINAATMIFAGSHTLQTALTGITLQLLQNPEAMGKVTAEVRSAFKPGDQINLNVLLTLTYLRAVIQEGMRLTSPVPLGLTRMIPEGGAVICGETLPAKTIVSYHSWAANTSPANFSEPRKFIPERWLEPDPDQPGQLNRMDFPHDKKDALQPFLQGPRDCIGQNLARLELHLILGRMLHAFDMTAPDGVSNLFVWENQSTYAVWDRSPLPVHLEMAQKTAI